MAGQEILNLIKIGRQQARYQTHKEKSHFTTLYCKTLIRYKLYLYQDGYDKFVRLGSFFESFSLKFRQKFWNNAWNQRESGFQSFIIIFRTKYWTEFSVAILRLLDKADFSRKSRGEIWHVTCHMLKQENDPIFDVERNWPVWLSIGSRNKLAIYLPNYITLIIAYCRDK